MYGIQRMEFLDDVLVLCGVGTGGGSHVYGNTLYVPPKKFFDSHEWAGITDWENQLGRVARTNSEKSPSRRCKCNGRMRRALHPAGMTGKAAAPPQTCGHICTSARLVPKPFAKSARWKVSATKTSASSGMQ